MHVVALHPSVRVERVGNDLLLLVGPQASAMQTSVLRASGPSQAVIECALNGTPVPDHLLAAAGVLADNGLITVMAANDHRVARFTPSRRQLLRLGAAGAAVGLVAMALPTATAAASTPVPLQFTATGDFTNECFDGTRQVVFTSSGTFTITAGSTMLSVAVVGGGGGGGGGGMTSASGGGGGGSVVTDTVEIAPPAYPEEFTITVGGAGFGGIALENGSPGEASSAFGLTANGGGGGISGSFGGPGGAGGSSGAFSGGAPTTSPQFLNSGGGGAGAGGDGGSPSGDGTLLVSGAGGLGVEVPFGIGDVTLGSGGSGGLTDPSFVGHTTAEVGAVDEGGGVGGLQNQPGGMAAQNRGGGGGGAGIGSNPGGIGGDGLVIVRWLDPTCPVG